MEKRGKFETGVEAGRNDAALMIAEPGRPWRLRVRSLAARGLAAVLLVAFAALLALPSSGPGADDGDGELEPGAKRPGGR